MRVPKFLREGSEYRLDANACTIAFFTVGWGIFLAIGVAYALTFFITTNFTGPCAGAGGVNAYAPNYVQCNNGRRASYERSTVKESTRP